MAVRRRSTQRAEKALTETIAGDPVQGARRLQRETKTGAWLTLHPSTVNGTEWCAQEWCDSLFMQYGIDPPDLPKYCDGYNTKFTICHALNCKMGGLVMARHNKLRDRVADLAGKAFPPSHMHNNPLIFVGCAVKRPKANPVRTIGSTNQDGAPLPEATEYKGDLLIRNLW